jgi:AcrR family transcriptional regulator
MSSAAVSLRESVIDAVDGLARSRGWTATTMTDVAEAAGVSRQSVYNEFGSRQALVEAYVVREIDALIDGVTAAVHAHADDARVALQAAFALFLELASDEPLVRVIVADAEDGELTRLLTGLGRTVAVARIGRLIEQVWPQVSAVDAALVAETLARLAISHALVPAASAAETAADVTRLLGPFVDEVLGVSCASAPS